EPIDVTLEDDLQRFMLSELDRMWARKETILITAGQSAIDPDFGTTMGEGPHKRYLETIKRRFIAHQEVGRVRSDLDPDATAHVVAAVTEYLTVNAQLMWRYDREWIRRLIGACAKVISAGIAAGNGEKVDGRRPAST